jgi:tetratricopeptide (TPR) repeat protein
MKLNLHLSFYFFAFFFLIQTHSALAQDRIIDSLENILNQTKDDSTQLVILNQLTNKSRYSNPEKSIAYILKGIELAEKQQNYKRLLTFQVQYSGYLSNTGKLDSALLIIEKATAYLPYISDVKNHLFLLTEHAGLLKGKGDFSGATKKYLEVLKIAEREKLPESLVASYVGLSALFGIQKMYVEAIEYNQKCIGICADLKPHRVSYCYGTTYTNLAIFYFKQKQIDSSIHYGLKAIKIKEELKNLRGLSYSYSTIANAYLKKKDTLTALQFLRKGLTTTQKTKDLSNQSIILASIAKIYIARKNLPESKKIITQFDSIAPKIQNPLLLVNYLRIKRNYCILKKDYKTALELFKNQFDITDSLRIEKNSTLIASLETKYRTDQHKIEKELAEKELLLSDERALQSKRNLIGVAIFTLLIILLLLYILSRLNVIKQQKAALDTAYDQLEQQKQNEVALLNLKALQAQMNPHFLFNALNSIQDLVLLKDIKNSTIYLGKFSALIRKILLSSKEQFISLDQEVEILQLYLDLEKLRFGDQLEIEFNCDILIEKQNHILLPAMFIQPYIENAIKHGLFHKKGLKKLLVDFSISNNLLTCVIEDNGIGQEKANEMKIKTLHLHTGFSTEAIQHRIKFLNQTLNKKIIIETKDLMENQQPQGTRVTLQFSLD